MLNSLPQALGSASDAKPLPGVSVAVLQGLKDQVASEDRVSLRLTPHRHACLLSRTQIQEAGFDPATMTSAQVFDQIIMASTDDGRTA